MSDETEPALREAETDSKVATAEADEVPASVEPASPPPGNAEVDAAVGDAPTTTEPPVTVSQSDTALSEKAESVAASGTSESVAIDPSPAPAQAEASAVSADKAIGGDPPESQESTRPQIGSKREGDPAQEMKARPQALEKGSDVQTHPEADLKKERTPPPPTSRESRLSPQLEAEIAAALGGKSLADIVAAGEEAGSKIGEELEPDTQHQGTIVGIREDNVFVDLGGRNQGVVSLKQFPEPPSVGDSVKVAVQSFDEEEGLYALTIPGAAVDVSGWSELSEGMVVEAAITGQNKGGLECQVNNLRGFIPASQIALYRVEDLAQFTGQKMLCAVADVNPDRKKLVLSHRAVLEREREESKRKILEELQVGQIRQGVVKKLQPFGAFVDLGGVDGLVHISQMSWDRIEHPSEVLTEGQQIKVKVNKIDKQTGKIGLAYRDLFESPWQGAAQKYPVQSTQNGAVSRLTDFGAFVKLEPGVEGLVHVSELAHKHVKRPADVVKEGEEIEVQVISVDEEKQRISLSRKALLARDDARGGNAQEDVPVPSPKIANPKSGSLKGGLNRPTGGEDIGLKW